MNQGKRMGPGEQRFLNVAAGECAGARLRARGTNIEALHLVQDPTPDSGEVQPAESAEGRLADARQQHAVGERRGTQDAGA